MDFIETSEELNRLSTHLGKLSREYFETRKKFGETKHNLFILLVPHQGTDGFQRASIDKQLINLLAITPEHHKDEVYSTYKSYISLQEAYKGLEKLLDAYSSRIMALQSLMKWQREND